MSNIEITPPVYTFHMNPGEDWQRTINPQLFNVETAPPINAFMEIRNPQLILVQKLDTTTAPTPAITIGSGQLVLHLTSKQTLGFGVGFPGVVQSASYWGIGRAYLYDLFVQYAVTNPVWVKLIYGTIQVKPAISTDLLTDL